MGGQASVWNPKTIINLSADTKRVEERFIATAGQTVFTLTEFVYVLATGSLEVHQNGLVLPESIDFTETTTATFTLTTGATVGDEILAVGYVAITGDVDVRDTDIYVTNYQAIRDYAGTEITIYAQGAATHADGGEAFFGKLTGAAPGTYVDDNDTTIVPTGGDGSAGWIRVPITLDVPFQVASLAAAKALDLGDFDRCETASYLASWEDSVAGPKGGAIYHSDGTTGTVSTIYTNRNGFYDSQGKGFRLSPNIPYDPYMFGAVGDGTDLAAGTDDTAALDAWYAAAKAADTTAVIKVGGYQFTSTRLFDGSIDVIGESKSDCFLYKVGNFTSIKVSNITGVEITGFTVRQVAAGGGGVGVDIYGGRHINFHDIYIKFHLNYSFQLRGGLYGTYKDIRMDGNTGTTMVIASGLGYGSGVNEEGEEPVATELAQYCTFENIYIDAGAVGLDILAGDFNKYDITVNNATQAMRCYTDNNVIILRDSFNNTPSILDIGAAKNHVIVVEGDLTDNSKSGGFSNNVVFDLPNSESYFPGPVAITGTFTANGVATFELTDDISNAFLAREGSNNYIRVDTDDAVEEIQFGNATTDPEFQFKGVGKATFGGRIQNTIVTTLAAGATPDVSGNNHFLSTDTTAITSFANMVPGQTIFISQKTNTRQLTHGSTLLCPGGINLSMAPGDTVIVSLFEGTIAHVMAHKVA